MPEEELILSKKKYKELEEELEELRNNRRAEVARALDDAKALGDLSENAEYHAARDEQAKIEDRIRQLEYMLSSARVVSGRSKTKKSEVTVGSTVSLRKKNARTIKKYKIVGAESSDILKNKISYTSPIGSALMGKTKGDVVEVPTPDGEVTYNIVKIS